MKSVFAWLWFLVSVALAVVLGVQSNRSAKQKTKLEAVQIQVEKLSENGRAAQAELEKLRAELQSVSVARQESKAPIASDPAQPTTTSVATAPSAASSSPNKASAGGGMAGMMANMMKDPEMRKALAQQQKMGLNMAYGTLFRQLQLTPEQEEKFKEILLDQQMSNMSQAGAMFDPGQDKAEVARGLAAEQKQREEQMKELLGEEKFAQYQEYNQTLGERMLLDQFGREVQITPEQNEQLLGIISEEKKNMQINASMMPGGLNKDFQAVLGSPEAGERLLQQQEQVNERVLERAGQVLTPEQVRKLGPVLQTQIEMQRASLKMAREMFSGDRKQGE